MSAPPPMIERLRRLYRREGPAGIRRAVVRRLPPFRPSGSAEPPPCAEVPDLPPSAPATLPMSAPYQVKLAGSLDERYTLLRGALPPGTRSVLDVGSNLGDIAARLATDGFFALGVERDRDLVERSRARHGDTAGTGVIRFEVEPERVVDLPRVDAVLLLSVHHHWIRAYGPEVAGGMLREIVRRTERVVIFETASRNVRYGAHPPGFRDNDEASVMGYVEDYLDHHVADLVDVRRLGKTPCVGEREPFRWMYALDVRR